MISSHPQSLLFFFPQPEGPPDRVEEVGTFMHECESEMVIKLTNAVSSVFILDDIGLIPKGSRITTHDIFD